MPADAGLIISVGNVGAAVVLFSTAAFLVFVPPVTLPKRTLALVLFLLAVTILPLGRWETPQQQESFFQDVSAMGAMATLAFAWVYPAPPKRRSAALACLAAAFALNIVGIYLYHANIIGVPVGYDTSAAGIAWSLWIPASQWALLVAAAVLRMRDAPPADARSAPLIMTALAGSLFMRPGAYVVYFLAPLFNVHGLLTPLSFGSIYADVGYTVPLVAFGRIVLPAVLLIWMWRRGLGALPLGLVAFGAAATAFSAAGPVDPYGAYVVLGALVPAYCIVRYGAMGTPHVPRRASYALAASLGVGMIVFASSLAVNSAADSPFALIMGAAVALAAGGAAGLVVLPSSVWPFPSAAPGTGLAVHPGATLGRYRVEATLAEGGQGRVFLARDAKLARQVVLKAGGSEGAAREARVMASLDHPNIARVHDVLDAADGPCIVMEYLPGGSLRARLADGPLPLREAVSVLDGVLAALEAAHARGIVHGDVKPENVLLDARGAPKLADFGSARSVAAGVTAQFAPSATLLYASPEQVRGQSPDLRSDLYGAGVLFHEMLTGKPVVSITGMDDFALREAILRKPVRLQLAGQPDWVRPFLSRALAKEPAKRWPSAQAMRAGLAAARVAA